MNTCNIPDWASEDLDKSFVGAVYEQEKEETETKSVPGDLIEKYLNWNKPRTVKPLRGKFVILLILLFFFHCIKQIDSILPCVCSVIDHRRRQNVVRTSVTHLPAVPRGRV